MLSLLGSPSCLSVTVLESDPGHGVVQDRTRDMSPIDIESNLALSVEFLRGGRRAAERARSSLRGVSTQSRKRCDMGRHSSKKTFNMRIVSCFHLAVNETSNGSTPGLLNIDMALNEFRHHRMFLVVAAVFLIAACSGCNESTRQDRRTQNGYYGGEGVYERTGQPSVLPGWTPRYY